MTEQGVMPGTVQCGRSANDQQSLLKHAAGAGRDEENVQVCLVPICAISKLLNAHLHEVGTELYSHILNILNFPSAYSVTFIPILFKLCQKYLTFLLSVYQSELHELETEI